MSSYSRDSSCLLALKSKCIISTMRRMLVQTHFAKWSPYILNTSTSGSMGLNRGHHKLEIRHKQGTTYCENGATATLVCRGVSGSKKSNGTDDPNQSKPRKKTEFYSSDQKPMITDKFVKLWELIINFASFNFRDEEVFSS
jgi:hypothetical protein